MKIKYNEDVMKFMSIFESLTNAEVKDCISNGDVTFIVEEGNMGKAIGKYGSNVKKMESLLKKKVRVIEFSSSVAQFIKNIAHPNEIREIAEENGNITIFGADTKSKSIIIGRDRRNINTLTNIVKRFFNINEIKVV